MFVSSSHGIYAVDYWEDGHPSLGNRFVPHGLTDMLAQLWGLRYWPCAECWGKECGLRVEKSRWTPHTPLIWVFIVKILNMNIKRMCSKLIPEWVGEMKNGETECLMLIGAFEEPVKEK